MPWLQLLPLLKFPCWFCSPTFTEAWLHVPAYGHRTERQSKRPRAGPPPVFHYPSIWLALPPLLCAGQLAAAAQLSLSWLGRRQKEHEGPFSPWAAGWCLLTGMQKGSRKLDLWKPSIEARGMVLHRAIQAARDGDLEALRDLASSGHLSPPISDSQGAGPVHHAARCGRLLCLQFLVSDLGMPADPRASNGATPAHDAAATGNIQELQWLVDQGGCKTQVSPSPEVGCTAEHACVILPA